ncbi:hypothetical protein ACJX0J_038324, partial [Zea mays]
MEKPSSDNIEELQILSLIAHHGPQPHTFMTSGTTDSICHIELPVSRHPEVLLKTRLGLFEKKNSLYVSLPDITKEEL